VFQLPMLQSVGPILVPFALDWTFRFFLFWFLQSYRDETRYPCITRTIMIARRMIKVQPIESLLLAQLDEERDEAVCVVELLPR